MIKQIVLVSALLLFGCEAALSHSLTVSLFESKVHMPKHILSTIGWGHHVPIDDLPHEKALESYALYGPNLERTDLPMFAEEHPEKFSTNNGFTVVSGDMAARKIILDEDCKSGTYRVGIVGKDAFYTGYIDENNRRTWAFKAKDEVTKAKKIMKGMLYRSVATSFFTVNEWQVPKPLGYDLEILPLTDLSNVRVGDLVQFEILFKGEKLNTNPMVSIEYITAVSDTFGGPDKFTLASMIHNGKGQFRMPAAGKWLVNMFKRQDVTADNALKDLVKKCDSVLFSSTVTFTVKP